jgi:hypothetical protein
MTREERAVTAGADAADIELVGSTLAHEGVAVASVDAASRRIKGRPNVAALERVFGTWLELAESPGPFGGTVTRRSAHEELSGPGPPAEIAVVALGVDHRPPGRVRFRPPHAPKGDAGAPGNQYTWEPFRYAG